MKRHFLAAVLLLLTGAVPSGAEVLVFDMGTPSSLVHPGARQVLADNAGWRSTEGLQGHDGPGQGTPLWTNPLNQDSIMGGAPNAFRFDAAPGPWSVHVICGFGSQWPAWEPQYWSFSVTVGAESWPFRISAPGYGGEYRMEHHTFDVVSDGSIEVALDPRSRWCLSAIIAWQPQDEAAAIEVIEEVERWAPDEELTKWREEPDLPTGPEPPLAEADQQRGFYVWHRHWANPIYPQTNPAPGEMDPTLRLFASPGEYEPLTFTVRTLREIERADVSVESIGPVPAENIEVRKVRFLPARRGYVDTGTYRVIPDILDRWHGGSLPGDDNTTFWLTLRVPEDAPPGIYRGQVRFTAGSRAPTDGATALIPVLLRVLDADLQDDPDHTYGIYYTHPLSRALSAPDELSRRHWERKAELEHADMVAHGTRNIVLSCWSPAADENGEFDLSGGLAFLDAALDLAQRFEFRPPYMVSIATNSVYEKYMGESLKSHLRDVKMPPEAFFSEMTALVRAIEEERVSRGWPEFVYQPYDEPGANIDTVEFAARLFQAVRAARGCAAGVRTYTTAAPDKPAYEPLIPYVDIWCTQTFIPDRDAALADMQARGVEYWCYPNNVSGENRHTEVPGARMTYGFGFWRSGFLRLIPWIYQHNTGDPFNYLDGPSMDFLNRSEPDGTPIPVALWEAYREGYDDMRYIYTLQQAIARAQGSGSAEARREAAEAQQTLDSVWDAIPVLPQYTDEGFWTPEEMDVRRWLIADRLERLTKLLRSLQAEG